MGNLTWRFQSCLRDSLPGATGFEAVNPARSFLFLVTKAFFASSRFERYRTESRNKLGIDRETTDEIENEWLRNRDDTGIGREASIVEDGYDGIPGSIDFQTTQS